MPPTIPSYEELNARYRARQHRRAALTLEGWVAYQVCQRNPSLHHEVTHSQGWHHGWQLASQGSPVPDNGQGPLALCPGVMLEPKQGSTATWTCAGCGWRLAPNPPGKPPYIPIHPEVAGDAFLASPLWGDSPKSLLGGKE
jgi:hypothetical protein